MEEIRQAQTTTPALTGLPAEQLPEASTPTSWITSIIGLGTQVASHTQRWTGAMQLTVRDWANVARSYLPIRPTTQPVRMPGELATLENIKSLLRNHRYGDGFSDTSFGHSAPFGPSIFNCGPEQSKKLRAIYQSLFSRKAGRVRIQDSLQVLLKTLDFCGEKLTKQGIRCLANRITIEVVLGIVIPHAKRDDFIAWLACEEDISIFTFFSNEKVVNFLVDALIWRLLEDCHFNKMEAELALRNLELIIRGNLTLGLHPMIESLREQPNFFQDIREELERLMAQGLTLPKAARKSETIRCVCLESLRRVPVVKEIERTVAEPMNAKTFGLPEQKIGRGYRLVARLDELAHNEDLVGEKPLAFCPMRGFIKDNKSEFWPGLDFLPFGHGPHQCPAWWLYKEVATQIVAILSYQYDWQTNSEGEAVPVKRQRLN